MKITSKNLPLINAKFCKSNRDEELNTVKKELLELTDRFNQQEADAELAQQELLERGRQDVDSATTELEVRFLIFFSK